MTTPVQKLLNALQTLRESVNTETRSQIDAVMREVRLTLLQMPTVAVEVSNTPFCYPQLTTSYDVYLPSLSGNRVKKDKELDSYMYG